MILFAEELDAQCEQWRPVNVDAGFLSRTRVLPFPELWTRVERRREMGLCGFSLVEGFARAHTCVWRVVQVCVVCGV